MAPRAGKGIYRVVLTNDWLLNDLYTFPHAYSQNYAFIYCFDTDLSPRNRARIDRALEGYPWRGGYSYVNIYTVLQNQVPPEYRPTVHAIRKSSPGWLDLVLNLDTAIQVAKAVAIVSGALASAAISYKACHKALLDVNIYRQKHRLQELQLNSAQAKEINAMSAEMAKYFGFKSLKELNSRTDNPKVTLKLLLAHYRRIATIVEYVTEGKAELPLIEHDTDENRH
jgi:hypothetical protein